MSAYGLSLVIVMPGAIYGPGDTSGLRQMWINYLQRKPPVIPGGSAQSWGHVEDIAHAHLLAMQQGTVGQTYIVAWPTHTFLELVTLAQRVTGILVPRSVSPGMQRALASVMGVAEQVLPIPRDFRSETLRTLAGTTYTATSAKAQREWGYAPRSLEEGLPNTPRDEMRLLGMRPPANG